VAQGRLRRRVAVQFHALAARGAAAKSTLGRYGLLQKL
jgi:hypothetical protein